MQGRRLKEALLEGLVVVGTVIEGIANSRQLSYYSDTGLDFVFIDNEHNPLDRSATGFVCQFFQAHGIAPLLRIPKADGNLGAMAVDGGASGVIAPYVESREEVLEVVGAIKERPLKGRALKEFQRTGEYPSLLTKEYIEAMNQDALVVIMIESREGVHALDEILSVQGVDVILVGPHDLSISLGIPEDVEHPLFVETVSQVARKVRERGLGFGIHLNNTNLHKFWMERGENFVVYSSDTYLATHYLKKGVQSIMGHYYR